MAIEITKDTIGIWFKKCNNGMADIMLSLYKKDGKIHISYRIRHYDKADPGNDAFSNKDRKTWFHGVSEGSQDVQEHIEKTRLFLKTLDLVEQKSFPVEECLMTDKGPEEFMERFKKLSFVHLKKVDKEEYERQKAS